MQSYEGCCVICLGQLGVDPYCSPRAFDHRRESSEVLICSWRLQVTQFCQQQKSIFSRCKLLWWEMLRSRHARAFLRPPSPNSRLSKPTQYFSLNSSRTAAMRRRPVQVLGSCLAPRTLCPTCCSSPRTPIARRYAQVQAAPSYSPEAADNLINTNSPPASPPGTTPYLDSKAC